MEYIILFFSILLIIASGIFSSRISTSRLKRHAALLEEERRQILARTEEERKSIKEEAGKEAQEILSEARRKGQDILSQAEEKMKTVLSRIQECKKEQDALERKIEAHRKELGYYEEADQVVHRMKKQSEDLLEEVRAKSEAMMENANTEVSIIMEEAQARAAALEEETSLKCYEKIAEVEKRAGEKEYSLHLRLMRMQASLEEKRRERDFAETQLQEKKIEMQQITSSCKEIKENYERQIEGLVESARKERDLILSGTNSDYFARELTRYSLLPENGTHIREWLRGDNSILAVRIKIDANLNAQKKVKRENGGHALYRDGNRPKGIIFPEDVASLMNMYFDMVADDIVKSVPRIGIEQGGKKLLMLKELCERKISGFYALKFKAEYIQLKMEQIGLSFEMETLKMQKREEEKAERERMREEERARRECEHEMKRAQKDEEIAQDALKRAHELLELESDNQKEKERLTAHIEKLEKALADARERGERAQSMAQQTRRGYVYVISNIGSFGEGVYKIGMTRRLDPMDRVNELGDASVPFPFDVHAMIFSEDAPALETALHKAFETKKVNVVNGKKEFFKVSLHEIKEEVAKAGHQTDFVEIPLAQQYRDSLLIG